jgi:hypothetical protein
VEKFNMPRKLCSLAATVQANGMGLFSPFGCFDRAKSGLSDGKQNEIHRLIDTMVKTIMPGYRQRRYLSMQTRSFLMVINIQCSVDRCTHLFETYRKAGFRVTNETRREFFALCVYDRPHIEHDIKGLPFTEFALEERQEWRGDARFNEEVEDDDA